MTFASVLLVPCHILPRHSFTFWIVDWFMFRQLFFRTGKSYMCRVSFLLNRTNLLATGNGTGQVMIWKLNDELTHQSAREQEQLDEIANSALD
jgi:hypothetical protein